MHERANKTKYKLCNIVRTGPDDCDRSHKKKNGFPFFQIIIL